MNNDKQLLQLGIDAFILTNMLNYTDLSADDFTRIMLAAEKIGKAQDAIGRDISADKILQSVLSRYETEKLTLHWANSHRNGTDYFDTQEAYDAGMVYHTALGNTMWKG